MATQPSQLPTGPLKDKLRRRFIAAYERQNPGITVKIAEPRLHLPGGPDAHTYAWEVIALRPDKTVLTALVAAVRSASKKATKFVDFTQVKHPDIDPARLMSLTNAMRDLTAHIWSKPGTATWASDGDREIPAV